MACISATRTCCAPRTARRPDAPLAVLTFEPHPREYFRPDDPPFRLTLSAERADALAALGVRLVYELPFDTAFTLITAEQFVKHVLHADLGARHLTCGPDFAFGHRRGGDAAFLADRAEALGIGTSTAIHARRRGRADLLEPHPPRVAGRLSGTRHRDLGRPWALRGPVMHGDKRGRTIGFPTANVPLGRHLEPARGVYAVTVRLADGSTHPGVANIGRRPTVNAGPESRLEVFLFDYSGDLYGAELAVALHVFLRGERKFAGIDELKAQIATDAAAARNVLGGPA